MEELIKMVDASPCVCYPYDMRNGIMVIEAPMKEYDDNHKITEKQKAYIEGLPNVYVYKRLVLNKISRHCACVIIKAATAYPNLKFNLKKQI